MLLVVRIDGAQPQDTRPEERRRFDTGYAVDLRRSDGLQAEPLRVDFSKSSWTAPVSNDTVNIGFKQLIKRTDPLRTGTYSKTLTFTLSTTQP